jgi:hypothetical protein
MWALFVFQKVPISRAMSSRSTSLDFFEFRCIFVLNQAQQTTIEYKTMTPYVQLQEALIRAFRKILDEAPMKLRALAEKYSNPQMGRLSDEDFAMLCEKGAIATDFYPTDYLHEHCITIIREQLDCDTSPVTIRNLLGSAFSTSYPMGYADFVRERGSGHNLLRTTRFSQPRALLKGDILSTGDKLLSEPREGGNGSVLLHLTGGFDGHWIGVPARIPIALLTPEDGSPPELVE